MTEEIRSLVAQERLPLTQDVSGTRTRAESVAGTRRPRASSAFAAATEGAPGAEGSQSVFADASRPVPPVHPEGPWADLLQLSAMLDDQCATLSDDRDVHDALRAALLDVGDMVETSSESAGEPGLPNRAVQALVATLRRWL